MGVFDFYEVFNINYRFEIKYLMSLLVLFRKVEALVLEGIQEKQMLLNGTWHASYHILKYL